MKKVVILLSLVLSYLGSFAQVSSYTFSSSSGTYTPLPSGTALIPPNSGISGVGWFEQCYNVPLPFVYYFSGKGYSSAYINSNGYLTFGKPGAVGNGRPESQNDGQSGTVMGYSCTTQYGYAGGAGTIPLGGLIDYSNANPIIYGTIGSAPNRIFVVQWTNCYRSVMYYGTASASGVETLTFQIRLKETSNVAELVYNTSTSNYAGTFYPTPGICGAAGDFNLVGGSVWTSVTNSTSSFVNIPFYSSVSIPAGVTFDFTPPVAEMPTACSGIPTAPTALTNTGITNGSVILSLAGLPLSTGLTYQWQSSVTGLANSWTNISGATNATCTLTPTVGAYYQCLVACGAGTPVASGSVAVGYESSYPAIPSYTYDCQGGWPYDNNGLVQITTGACGTSLNDASNSLSDYNYTAWGGSGGTAYSFVDYTASATHIKLQGSTSSASTFTFFNNNYGTYAPTVGVWIDFNDNGSFTDAGEYVGSETGAAGALTSFSISVPANTFGIHRMRVRSVYSGGYGTGTIIPVGALSFFGQGLDYMVEIVPPTPAPTSNSPLCVNGTLTLSSTALAGATYTWTGPLSLYATTGGANMNLSATSTTMGGTYTLNTTVDGSNACVSNTTNVTVNLQPSLTGVSSSGTICAGNTLALTANGASNVTGYSWTGPATITNSTTANASVTSAAPSATGTYTVAVNNGTGSACTLTYTTSATVNAVPNVTVFGTSVANSCINSAATATLSSSSLGAATYSINYTLTGANSIPSATGTVTISGSSGTFSTPVLASAGATTLTVNSITNGNGCTSVLSSGNVFTFTVNALPSPIGGTAVVCAGLTTTLTDVGVGTWTSNNTATATAAPTTGVITGVSGGITSISFTSSATGCTITTPLTVNQTPAITGVFGACVGNTANLNDATAGGTWTSTNISIATVGTSSGVLTGVALGSATISYTLPTTGCSATQLVTITSPPSPFIMTGGGPYCTGGTPPHIGLSGSALGFGYQLMLGGSLIGSAIPGGGGTIDFGPQSTPGLYTAVANPGTSCATPMIGSIAVSTLPLPIQYTVSGGGGYCTGGTGVHVYLSGSNTGISYQLQKAGVSTGSPVAGSSAVLDFGLQTAAGTYTVQATNTTTGCTNAMSGSVTVTINVLPTAFSVTGTGNYCAGGTGRAVGVSNSTTGVNYQLFLGSSSVGAPVAGNTGSAVNFGNQTAGTYTVVATNTTTGCASNMSSSAVVTAIALPALNTVTGGGAYCTGATGVHIGLNGSVAGVNYQVYNGVPVGGLVAGTGSALDLGAQTAGTYTVVGTTATGGCSSNMLGSATVTINPSPAVNTVTGGGPYCAGTGGVHIGLNGSVLGINYYLYNGSTLSGGAFGTGAPLDFGALTAAGTYTVTAIVASTGCSGNMTGSVVVTINTQPTAFNVTGGGNYCAGSAGSHVFLSNSTTGVKYQLLNGSTPAGAAVNGTSGSSIDFGPQPAAGTYTVLATTVATGCMNTMTGSVVIGINPLPSPYTVTGGGGYCSGGTGVHVGLASSGTGINYQLYNTGGPVGAVMAGTGSSIDFGLQTGASAYTVVATNATTTCAVNMPGTVAVAVNPLPNPYLVTGGGSYCTFTSGSDIGLLNSDAGIRYQLYNGSSPVGTSAAGSGTSIDFGMQTTAGSYTAIATNSATGCTNTMTGSVAIGISPTPTAFAVSGGGNICPGSSAHVGLAGSSSGVNYQLYKSGTSTGPSVAGTGAALDFGAQTAAGSYTVVANNPSTTCTASMSGSVAITINPLPGLHSVTGGGSYCNGASGMHIGLNGSDVGNSYQLIHGGVSAGAPMPGTGSALDFGAETLPGGYTVVATSGAGCNNSMSGGAVVSVNPLPAVHDVTGGGGYCPGTIGAVMGLDGSDLGIYYQLSLGSVATGSPVSGSGGLVVFTPQTTTGTYNVIATDATSGCANMMAGSVNVSLSSQPVAYNVTGGGHYCSGGAGQHVVLSNSNTGINYQLFNSGSPIDTPLAGTGTSIDFGRLGAGSYTVVAVSGVTGCFNNMSGAANVIADPLPAPYTVGGGGAYCSGGTGSDVTLSGSQTGVTYQPKVGGSSVGAAYSGTGSGLDFGMQTTGGYYTVMATDGTTGCTSVMPDSVQVVINALPLNYTVSGGGAFCASGTGAHVLLSGSTSGTNYQLLNGTTLTDVPLVGTGGTLDFGLQTANGTYTVMGTVAATNCKATMGGSATISTLPLPAAFNVTGGGSYCSGGSGVGVSLGGSVSGVSYQLYNGTPLGSAVTGTGAAINFGPQTGAGGYTVFATDPSTGCSNSMTGSATVNVSSLPAVYAVGASSMTGYCSGGSGVGIYLTNSETGVSYQLYHNGVTEGAAVTGTTGAASFGYQTAIGLYTVKATNPAGCTANMGGSVPVSINPLPLTYTVTGGGGYCSGATGSHIGLSGTSSGVSYQLIQGTTALGSAIIGSGPGIDFGLQTIAGSYTVLATIPSTGCSNTMTGTATVSVNPSPAAYTITGGGSFCTGTTGVHVGLSGSVAGVNYQLKNGLISEGLPKTGTGSAIDFGTEGTGGAYTVIATNSTTGCNATMTGGVTVTALPLPAAHPVTGGGAYCSGGTGVPVGLSGSNSGVSYQLYNGSTLMDTKTGTGSTVSFARQTVAGTYTVIAEDLSTTCVGPMPGSTTVVVNPLPSVYPISGGGNYCAGTAGSDIGLGSSDNGINYTLQNGGIGTGTAMTGTGTAIDFGMQTVTGLYTIEAQNAATGCTSLMSGGATVGITPVVTPSVMITGGGDTSCSGVATTYIATITNGGTAPTYQWTVGGAVRSTSASYTYTPADGDNLSVIVTSSAACALPSTATNNMTLSVLAHGMPGVNVSADPGTEVCRGTSVLFSAATVYGGVSPSYEWKNQAGDVLGTGATLSYAPQNGDVITCKLTSDYACRLSTTITSTGVAMTVDSPATPQVTITAYPGTSIAVGETEVLTAVVTNGGPSPSYQWSVGGTAVPGANSQTFTSSNFTDGAVVSCNVTSSNTCGAITGSSATTIHVSNVGVQQLTARNVNVTVVPNPNRGNFAVRGTTGTEDEEGTIEITNMLGQTLYSSKVVIVKGAINEQVQLGSNVSNGIYLLNLHTAAGTTVFHVVVEQ